MATVGGMVSTNASGIYSVRYGGTREYVLAMTIVTGEGQIIKLGNRAVKRSSGYNLTDLIAGSEGTLAIVGAVTSSITTACMIRYVRLADPELLPPGRHPSLDALSQRCESLPPFQETFPADYALPPERN